MARKAQIALADDLSSSAEETSVRFTMDGVEYEIDLNVQHAAEFRGLIEDWSQKGRRVGD